MGRAAVVAADRAAGHAEVVRGGAQAGRVESRLGRRGARRMAGAPFRARARRLAGRDRRRAAGSVRRRASCAGRLRRLRVTSPFAYRSRGIDTPRTPRQVSPPQCCARRAAAPTRPRARSTWLPGSSAWARLLAHEDGSTGQAPACGVTVGRRTAAVPARDGQPDAYTAFSEAFDEDADGSAGRRTVEP